MTLFQPDRFIILHYSLSHWEKVPVLAKNFFTELA
jgi:hypothetical protein